MKNCSTYLKLHRLLCFPLARLSKTLSKLSFKSASKFVFQMSLCCDTSVQKSLKTNPQIFLHWHFCHDAHSSKMIPKWFYHYVNLKVHLLKGGGEGGEEKRGPTWQWPTALSTMPPLSLQKPWSKHLLPIKKLQYQ